MPLTARNGWPVRLFYFTSIWILITDEAATVLVQIVQAGMVAAGREGQGQAPKNLQLIFRFRRGLD